MKICAIVGCLVVLSACGRIEAGNHHPPNYDMLTPCKRPQQVAYASIYADSLCGTIDVYEDRAAGTGRKIGLHLMVIQARQSTPRPDPVFFLAGGPGQAATDVGPAVFSILTRMRKDHDVVLLDQRGTGKSNSLACNVGGPFNDADMPLDSLEGRQVEELKECLHRFSANPALYTTPIAMDDLNEVRKVLGYSKIDLYGISYGTRAALVYMRRHGETVRSAILDSVAPLTMSIPAKIAVDAQGAFDKLLADCAADRACNSRFPDLADQFQRLLARLADHPEEVTLTHPRTGRQVHLLLESRTLTRLVRSILYDRTLSSLLPLAIHDAWRNNFQPLVTLGYSMTAGNTDFSLGMMASVLCSEDMRNTTGPDPTRDFDNGVYNSLAPVCRFWPKGALPDDYFAPVTSGVPTLLITGTLDPVTPPRYALQAARTLSDSTVVIVPGVGHSASLHGCLPGLMADFLDDPEPRKLDSSCVAVLRRPAFFTSPAGTAIAQDGRHD